MQRMIRVALAAASLALLLPAAAAAQTESAAADTEIPPVQYRIKKIALTFHGGRFSGGKFLELPTPGPRTQQAIGSDVVYKYDGQPFVLPAYYSAPVKEIRPGNFLGGTVSFYLSEEFHLDLRATVASSTAETSFLNARDPQASFREVLDTDGGFKSLTLGGGLNYDARQVALFGIVPSIGCGFGGVINRFSQLEDKTALFFQINAGLSHTLTHNILLGAHLAATTFAFTREELHYTKQLTYVNLSLGLTYLIDMVPGI